VVILAILTSWTTDLYFWGFPFVVSVVTDGGCQGPCPPFNWLAFAGNGVVWCLAGVVIFFMLDRFFYFKRKHQNSNKI
jgi:hypothetical protein